MSITESSVPRETRRSPYRALVVDDDEETLAFAAEALNSFVPGFEVATARDLEQAAAWLETFHPDILLLESGLAGEGKGDFTGRLHADPRTRHCKILMLGGRSADQPLLNETLTDDEAVLPKPLGLQTLLATVRRLLGPPDGH